MKRAARGKGEIAERRHTIIKDYIRERERLGREVFVPLAHPPGNAEADFGEAVVNRPGFPRESNSHRMSLMESKKQTPKYTAEFRERGVRLYREQRADYSSDNAAYRAIASKLGCSHDTLRAWCIQASRDAGERSGPSNEEKTRIKELEREVKELRTANEILKKASAYFAQAELDRRSRT